jgi:hypothetical protein
MVTQMHVLMRTPEEICRRIFRPQALIGLMEGVNRREEYFDSGGLLFHRERFGERGKSRRWKTPRRCGSG